MAWKYNPSDVVKDNNYNNVEKWLNEYATDTPNCVTSGTDLRQKYPLRDCLETFFKKEWVQEAVNNNDWVAVIEYWNHGVASHSGNVPRYFNYNLTDFLYLMGIEFWEYLPDNFIPRDYNLIGRVVRR